MVEDVELVKFEWINEYTNLSIAKYGLPRDKAYKNALDEYSKMQNAYKDYGYCSPDDWIV